MRTKRLIATVSLVALVSVACGSNGRSPASRSNAAVGQTPSASIPEVRLTVSAPAGATMSGFRQTALEAPDGAGMRITFHNGDVGVPHNIQFFDGSSTTGTPLWAPPDNAMISGVAETVYEVPGLPAGTYAYNCYAHPATMIGTLTVGAA